jgi:hypothetical protein
VQIQSFKVRNNNFPQIKFVSENDQEVIKTITMNREVKSEVYEEMSNIKKIMLEQIGFTKINVKKDDYGRGEILTHEWVSARAVKFKYDSETGDVKAIQVEMEMRRKNNQTVKIDSGEIQLIDQEPEFSEAVYKMLEKMEHFTKTWDRILTRQENTLFDQSES